MIDKETFRKTEEKLINYFNKEQAIKSIQHKIEILKQQINELDYRISHTDIHLEEESKSPSFEERVQTSSTGESYAEKNCMKQIDRLIRFRDNRQEELDSTMEKSMEITADNSIIDFNINSLKEDNMPTLSQDAIELLKVKYFPRKHSDLYVSEKLNISKSAVNREKMKLIENIAAWEDWQH